MTFETWQHTVRTVCGPLESQARSGGAFKGSVNLRRVADVTMIEHQATVEGLHWDRRHIAEITSPFCYVILQLAQQSLRVAQDGEEVELAQGDWTLIDSLRPAKFKFQESMHILALNLPRELVATRARDQDIPYAQHRSGSQGASAVFTSFARSLYEHAPTLHPEDLRHRENVLDLLFVSLPGDFDARDRARARQLQRAMKFIDAHLGDPELSPQFVASTLGVSVRHLHRLFKETGRSMGEWTMHQRLQRARCDLADERFRGNTVLDLALASGFKDGAHFSRVFRAAFGISPREYRRQTLTPGE